MGQPWSAFANACRRIRARPSPISAFAVPRTSSATPKRSPRSLWDAAPMSMRPTKRRVAKPVPPQKGLLPWPNICAASVEASTAVSTEPPLGRGSASAPTTCKSFCNSTEPRPLRRARCSSSTSSRSPWLAHSPQCIGLHSVTAPGPLPVTRAPANGRDRTGLTDIDADALQHLVRRANFLPYLPYGPSHDLITYLAAQLHVPSESIGVYGSREKTRQGHMQDVLSYLGFRRFQPDDQDALQDWLLERALEHDKPTLLLQMACEHLKQQKL